MRRRRAFEGQEWASRDTYWLGAFLALLLAGVAEVMFFYAALLLALAFLVVLGLRLLGRRRVEQANEDSPFWVDEIGPPSDS